MSPAARPSIYSASPVASMITGPAPNGTLAGDPLAGQHLAVIAATNTGDELFRVDSNT